MQPSAGEKRRVPGVPFKAGPDPRRAGNGRKRATPEQKREAELAALAKKEVVRDLVADLGMYSRAALERLVMLTQNDDPSVALAAVKDLLDRCFGRAPAQMQIDMNARVQMTGARVVSAEDIRQAMQRLQAGMAEDALLKQQPEAAEQEAADPAVIAARLVVVNGVAHAGDQ